MAFMAVGGIAASLLASRLEGRWPPERRLQAGLLGCAISALLTLPVLNGIAAAALSFSIGASVGLLTVTLVAHLYLWIGIARPLLKIGLGVGLAYLVCNCPLLFDASPAGIALFSAGLCVVGARFAPRDINTPSGPKAFPDAPPPPFLLVLAGFTALVWLDSAAFFIIQNTPDLKSGTWEGGRRLWQNGVLHFVAALAGGVMVRRRGLSTTLALAFGLLGGSCLLLLNPGQQGMAAVLYPLGVSLYSVALVAYPTYVAAKDSTTERSRAAGQLYAVAGWMGSAMGIGMAQDLRRIPPAFVLGTAMLYVAPHVRAAFRARKRELGTIAVLLSAVWGLQQTARWAWERPRESVGSTLVSRGRQVYISEGCIHCHSQYVRPGSSDEVMWGPTVNVVVRRTEEPPLIGNRRQGPDLSEVGSRRSALWLRAHFLNPAMLVRESPMPSYAHLFADQRGEALLACVQSLGNTHGAAHLALILTAWRVSNVAMTEAQDREGGGTDG